MKSFWLVVMVLVGGCADDPKGSDGAIEDCCFLWPDTDAIRVCALANTELCYCSDLTCTLGGTFKVCQEACVDAGVE